MPLTIGRHNELDQTLRIDSWFSQFLLGMDPMNHLVCCQWNLVWEDKEANFRRAEQLLLRSRPPKGSLVLLPEMFATGFTMNVLAAAEPPEGPTWRFLADTARRFGIFLHGGLVIADGAGRARNESITFSPQGVPVARYAKMHLFSYAGESRRYAPGDRPCVFSWGESPVGTAICYDLRFPELFRTMVTAGAVVFAVIACWPAARAEHWRVLTAARAIENLCYLAAVNRCGSEPNGLPYAGGSRILDPRGRILAEAGEDDDVISAEVDFDDLDQYRREFPALNDRRLPAAFNRVES